MTEGSTGFTFGAYVRDRAFALVAFAISLLLVAFMLACLDLNAAAIITVEAVLTILFAIAFLYDLHRRKPFWDEMHASAQQTSKANYLLSLTERPEFLDGALAYDLLEGAVRDCNGDIQAMRAEHDDYRQYIELWIHEAKAPIAAASLIAERTDAADDLIPELERIERLVMTALFYARATSTTFDYAIHATELLSACQEACKQNARFLISRGVRPEFSIDDAITVQADRSWLLFMLTQVVINAAQYGARTIRFEAHRRDDSELLDHVVLSVVDDGDGIPAQDMDSVFERAYVGENGRRTGKATGMGLYLVALMAARCGIHVLLTSEEGQGTTVTFEFPQDLSRKRLLEPGSKAGPVR